METVFHETEADNEYIKIKCRLDEIYDQIPVFDCKHCHECTGPIVWFKPEEMMIREYLKRNLLEYIVWSREEFERHNWQCPYLKNDRCSIYPVRPIVCRLQGNITELPCKYNVGNYMSAEEFRRIKTQFDIVVRDVHGVGCVYGTRKLELY